MTTKKSNEFMAHTYSHLFQIPVTGLRFFTVYGPWGRPDMAYFKFVDAIAQGRSIDVYNHGKMKRDFTFVDDLVEGGGGAAAAHEDEAEGERKRRQKMSRLEHRAPACSTS